MAHINYTIVTGDSLISAKACRLHHLSMWGSGAVALANIKDGVNNAARTRFGFAALENQTTPLNLPGGMLFERGLAIDVVSGVSEIVVGWTSEPDPD